MTPKDQDQLVEDLKREYPAASQVPAAMKKAREVIAGYYPADEGERWYGTKKADVDRYVDEVLGDLKVAGLVILPREPDEGMVAAAMKNGFEGTDEHLKSDYRAMVQHYESNSGGGE